MAIRGQVSGGGTHDAVPVDQAPLPAKIGQLALENDFFEGAFTTPTADVQNPPPNYQARHSGDGQSCSVVLTDGTTGTMPSEARRVVVAPGCR